jgi:UDP-3-O-[3-hydroxymyristoyl] glucosamine N-acyltransferase
MDFLSSSELLAGSCINLVIRDINLRKQITQHLDSNSYKRFSLIHDRSYTSSADIALGCMIYPMTSIYSGAVLQQDVIVHSLTLIAHQCQIGVGTFISGGVTVAGNTAIGEFSHIGIDATIYNQISMPPDTTIGASTVVRKSIVDSGTYSSQLKNNLVKIK